MPKTTANLTDTQLVILSAAAQRSNGYVLPLPRSLKVKGAAVTKMLEGLLRRGLLKEKSGRRNAAVWREAEDGRPMMLVITNTGLRAIDAGPENSPKGPTTSVRTAPVRSRAKQSGKFPASHSAPTVKTGTKQALLIDLLKRKKGATIDDAVKATGWQAHSVRGAISGALKKKLGLAICTEMVEGRGRVYRIAGQR